MHDASELRRVRAGRAAVHERPVRACRRCLHVVQLRRVRRVRQPRDVHIVQQGLLPLGRVVLKVRRGLIVVQRGERSVARP